MKLLFPGATRALVAPLGLLTAALLGATQAMGATWSLTNGKYSKVAGAKHETFDTVAVDPKESLDLNWTSNGKAIILGNTDSTKACYKPGGTLSTAAVSRPRGAISARVAPGKVCFIVLPGAAANLTSHRTFCIQALDPATKSLTRGSANCEK